MWYRLINGNKVYWTGTIIRQSYLAYFCLRLATWVDGAQEFWKQI